MFLKASCMPPLSFQMVNSKGQGEQRYIEQNMTSDKFNVFESLWKLLTYKVFPNFLQMADYSDLHNI